MSPVLIACLFLCIGLIQASEDDQIKEILRRLEEETQKRRELEQKMASQSTQLVSMQRELLQIKQAPDRASAPPMVAFMARGCRIGVRLAPRQRLPFDEVLFNIPGYYNKEFFHFKCPDRGMYFINTSVLSHTGWNLHYQIIQDSKVVIQGHTGRGTSRDQNTGGQATLIQCQPNHLIWVQRGSHGGREAFDADYSTFMGFRISK